MKLTSTLYEKNLLYQQLNFKYVLSCYVYSTVWKLEPSNRKGRNKVLTLTFLCFYLIDFIVGVVLLAIILHNPLIKHKIKDILSLYTSTALESVREHIVWLMGVPWGIKLNTPLNQFLGSRYLYILDLWKLFYGQFISIYLSLIINLQLLLLPFGASLGITALHDFLKFLNLCLISFFIISNRLFVLQVSALKSLGRLFMGKKWNILKERVDSYNFDINQLLIGTIIFTILLFLLPTTSMYMVVFLYLRLLQFAVQFALRLCAVCINKVTVNSVAYLHTSLQDQPITEAEVLISGLTLCEYARRKIVQPYKTVDGKWCKLECFSVDQNDIKIKWNGKEYSVDEIREISKAIPAETIMEELKQYDSSGLSTVPVHSSGIDGVIKSHSMMYWFWALPKN